MSEQRLKTNIRLLLTELNLMCIFGRVSRLTILLSILILPVEAVSVKSGP